jgi:hypothetical protein
MQKINFGDGKGNGMSSFDGQIGEAAKDLQRRSSAFGEG